MYLVIPTLLNDAEQLQIKELLNTATFTSGKITATGAALKVKNNEQLDREAYHTKAINQVLEKALMTSPIFKESTQPKSILPFLISRYYPNMEYGWHVDSPLMAVDQYMIRVDLSITIFLNAASEYESGELEIDSASFQSLINFVEENQNQEDFDKAFSIYQKKGKRFIKVKSYVGVIETKQGVVIEILPKTFIGKNGEEANKDDSKKLLLTMLKTLKKSPFINLNVAHLKEQKNFPILEVFIASFLDELIKLTNKELRGDYVSIEENTSYLKGKLLLKEHIKNNQSTKKIFIIFLEIYFILKKLCGGKQFRVWHSFISTRNLNLFFVFVYFLQAVGMASKLLQLIMQFFFNYNIYLVGSFCYDRN